MAGAALRQVGKGFDVWPGEGSAPLVGPLLTPFRNGIRPLSSEMLTKRRWEETTVTKFTVFLPAYSPSPLRLPEALPDLTHPKQLFLI